MLDGPTDCCLNGTTPLGLRLLLCTAALAKQFTTRELDCVFCAGTIGPCYPCNLCGTSSVPFSWQRLFVIVDRQPHA